MIRLILVVVVMLYSAQGQDPCVDEINMYRQMHMNTPNLEYSESLSQTAQDFAENLLANADVSSVKLRHDPDMPQGVGETLWFKQGGTLGDCTDALRSWYSEKQYWNYATSSSISAVRVTGDFAQMVWEASTDVGFGVATDEQKDYTFVVGRYSPRRGADAANNVHRIKPGATLPPIDTCVDDSPDECSTWVNESNACTYDFMKEYCKKSCHICSGFDARDELEEMFDFSYE